MSKCIKRTKVSHVKVEERGRKAIFDNLSNDTFIVTTFDGCVVSQNTAADYIVRPDDTLDIIVELKGRNIDRAEAQIAATYRYIKKHDCADTVSALIVSSKVPLGGEQSNRIVENLKRVGIRRVKIKTAQWAGSKAEFI